MVHHATSLKTAQRLNCLNNNACGKLKDMKRVGNKWLSDQRGASNPLLIATILLSVFLVAAAGGFIWAYMEMTDWRNNTQSKIDAAVETAKTQQKEEDDARFQEEQKQPNIIYQGPSDMGSVRFRYPKTWSAYTNKSDNNGLEVYFNPVIVPVINDGVTPYSLRLKVTNEAYADVIDSYQSLVEDGLVTASTIKLGEVKDENAGGEADSNKSTEADVYEGIRVDGQITDTINGSVVIFKIRDKTLQLFVDSQDYMKDFNETILTSLKFQL